MESIIHSFIQLQSKPNASNSLFGVQERLARKTNSQSALPFLAVVVAIGMVLHGTDKLATGTDHIAGIPNAENVSFAPQARRARVKVSGNGRFRLVGRAQGNVDTGIDLNQIAPLVTVVIVGRW